MATQSSVPAWRIPGMGEPGELPSMGSHKVRHDWSDLAAAAAAAGWFLKDREAWCAAVHGVAKSPIWLSNWTTTTSVQIFQCIPLSTPLQQSLLLLFFLYFLNIWDFVLCLLQRHWNCLERVGFDKLCMLERFLWRHSNNQVKYEYKFWILF